MSNAIGVSAVSLKSRNKLIKGLAILAFGALMVGATVSPAKADPYHGHGGPGWHDRGRPHYVHNNWRGRPYYGYYGPRYHYVYAPPPVVYAPPPPPPGINVVIPLNFD